jgi:hypothetical protein
MRIFKSGMIVKDSQGVIIEVESYIAAGEGYISVRGVQLTKKLTPDKRKWSQRRSILHTPSNPLTVVENA